MSAPRTVPFRLGSALALVAAAGLTGCTARDSAADAAAASAATESCGSPDVVADWPAELTEGTVLVVEGETSYEVRTDCGVLTLIRAYDPGYCQYMTGYGLQRYPC